MTCWFVGEKSHSKVETIIIKKTLNTVGHVYLYVYIYTQLVDLYGKCRYRYTMIYHTLTVKRSCYPKMCLDVVSFMQTNLQDAPVRAEVR